MPFMEDETWSAEFQAWEEHEALMRQQDLIRWIIMGGIILVIAVLFFVLVKSVINAAKPPQPVPAEGAGLDYLIDDDEMDSEARLAAEIEAQRLMDIELQAKQAELNSIEGFIDKDPASVAQLLRNWLTDD
jgi:flagellar biosynthesis/type III secretory pathway M-ring protein FliF/YscJ